MTRERMTWALQDLLAWADGEEVPFPFCLDIRIIRPGVVQFRTEEDGVFRLTLTKPRKP